MIDEELVRAAYLALLGRPPENETVVRGQLVGAHTPLELLQNFVHSPEYQRRTNSFFSVLSNGMTSAATHIDVSVTPKLLSELFLRTKGQWEILGKTEPYWSVLTHDKFRHASIDKNIEEFAQSGKADVDAMGLALDRGAMKLPRGCCLELGCGVGRLTRFLSMHFEQVIGVDVSEGNLSICRDYLRKSGVSNVDLVHLKSVEQLGDLPPFDFFFSLIVLQHNSPPVMKYFLDTLLGKVRPGGGAYFQIPTHTPGYSFDVDSYLRSDETIFDMHVLPMFEVFESLSKSGFDVREVMMDTWTAMYGSHTFLAEKTKSGKARKPRRS